jgi:hypothetical protein
MGEPRGDRKAGSFQATLECGPYSVDGEVAGLGERAVSSFAFAALRSLVDDAATEPDELGEFITVTLPQPRQIWVYATDVFLRNLLHGRGDQTRVRRALDRLESQDEADESGSA